MKDHDALYKLVDASSSDHFVFTSSGAEAINQVIMGSYLEDTRRTGKHHYLSAATEGSAVVLSMKRLEKMGCHYEKVYPISVDAFAEAITPRTALISISAANALTGVIHPISAIAGLCKERDIALHVDASSILGKGYFSFKECGADYLTFNGEQIGGPKGSGALFIRAGRELPPLILGKGEDDEQKLTELIHAAVACHETSDQFCLEKAHLRNLFEERVCAALTDTVIFFKDFPRVVSVSAMGFAGVHHDALYYLLGRQNLLVSKGGGELQKIAHMLKACQIAPPLCYSGLSFALKAETTQQQLEISADALISAVQQLKRYFGGV